MPDDASTGSETAPLTRMRRLPRYMSIANLRAGAGKSAASADSSSRVSLLARSIWSSQGKLQQNFCCKRSWAAGQWVSDVGTKGLGVPPATDPAVHKGGKGFLRLRLLRGPRSGAL
eukprot:883544-Amphidinium_carterae.1